MDDIKDLIQGTVPQQIARLELIIQEKDKIITALRAQLEREAQTHREFMRMMGLAKEFGVPEPKWSDRYSCYVWPWEDDAAEEPT